MNRGITISRQFGSGGREFGIKLANALGLPCYDKELISMAAEDSNLSAEFMRHHEESAPGLLSRTLYSYYQMPMTDQIYIAQSNLIKRLAQEGPCVIIGRCADYILRDHPNCLNVFVHADKTARIKRIVGKGLCEEKKAPDFVTKKDKQRANYYNFYSNNRWDDLQNYDLTIDTSRFSVDLAVQMLIDAAKMLDK